MLTTLIGILAIAYLGACLFLVAWQRKIIFFPSNVLEKTPQDLGLDHEEVWLQVGEMRLHGWWLPLSLLNKESLKTATKRQTESRESNFESQFLSPLSLKSATQKEETEQNKVLLFLHGNGENIAANLNKAKIFQELGFSVLLIDYRGYGLSEGEFPSESQVYEDAQAAWNYLTQDRNIAPENIIIYGHSLGGAIAINLAVQHPEAAGLIVEGTFTSIQDMAKYQKIYQIFPLSLILHQKFDSINQLKSLKIPILLIHGTADDVVPYVMSQILFDSAKVPKRILLVPQADHNNVATLGGETYRQSIHDFSDLIIALKRNKVGVK
jgi:pimeloyl-ACP methyl ester carboxylesterase